MIASDVIHVKNSLHKQNYVPISVFFLIPSSLDCYSPIKPCRILMQIIEEEKEAEEGKEREEINGR